MATTRATMERPAPPGMLGTRARTMVRSRLIQGATSQCLCHVGGLLAALWHFATAIREQQTATFAVRRTEVMIFDIAYLETLAGCVRVQTARGYQRVTLHCFQRERRLSQPWKFP